MKVIYGREGEYRQQCSGKNWTTGKRCSNRPIFQLESGELGEDLEVYCQVHRYQAKGTTDA